MKEILLNFYQQMNLIRNFDEKLLELFAEKKICGFIHPCHGHEAIAVGVINAMQKNDQVVSYYRGHGHCLARGSSPDFMMAEVMGKKTGYCAGRGGSLHLVDIDHGVIATSGVVSEALPIATGAALANKTQKNGKVLACFFGDGATNNGMFYESLNFAAYLNLPILYVCENNGYAMSLRTSSTMGSSDIANKARAIGVTAKAMDGTDVMNVYDTTTAIIEEIRKTSRPFLLECNTVRLKGHTAYDGDGLRYRSEEELMHEKKRCPITKLKSLLLTKNKVLENSLQEIEQKVSHIIAKAVEFAEQSVEAEVAHVYKHLSESKEGEI